MLARACIRTYHDILIIPQLVLQGTLVHLQGIFEGVVSEDIQYSRIKGGLNAHTMHADYLSLSENECVHV